MSESVCWYTLSLIVFMSNTLTRKKPVKKHKTTARNTLPQQDRFKYIFVLPMNSSQKTVAFRRYTGPKYGHGHF